MQHRVSGVRPQTGEALVVGRDAGKPGRGLTGQLWWPVGNHAGPDPAPGQANDASLSDGETRITGQRTDIMEHRSCQKDNEIAAVIRRWSHPLVVATQTEP